MNKEKEGGVDRTDFLMDYGFGTFKKRKKNKKQFHIWIPE